MSELVQAVVILCTFHSLCGFVFGCGVVPEIDLEGGWIMDSPNAESENESEKSHFEFDKETDKLILRLKATDNYRSNSPCGFETCASEEVESASRESPKVTETLKRFCGSPEFKHEDFDVKSTDYSVFRLQDYCWQDHGCSLVSKYVPGLGDLLDQEFNQVLNMTDRS